MVFWAEIFGILAFSFGLIAYQIKKPRIALWILCIPCIFWILHFLVLAQFAGFMISVVALIRNICAASFSDKYIKISTTICLVLCFVLTVPTIEEAKDILPLCAALAISSAIYRRDMPFQFRMCNFFGELSWLGYGLCIASMSLSFASALMITSITISVLRHDLKFFNTPGHKNTMHQAGTG